MIKSIAFNITLARIVAKGQTVNFLQILISLGSEIFMGDFLLQVFGFSLHCGDAIHRIRMGGKPGRQSAAIRAGIHPVQGFKKCGHIIRVIAGFERIFHAEIICLALIVPAKTQKQHAHAELRQTGVLTEFL